MISHICLAFRFIQPVALYHGRTTGDEPEWPPSPMRAFQALLNAAAIRARGKALADSLREALHAIERAQPQIITPHAQLCRTGHRAYVPHNHADLVAARWFRGDSHATIAEHRVEKDHRPHRLSPTQTDLPTVYYLYSLPHPPGHIDALAQHLRPAARAMHCLGWGMDQIVGDAFALTSRQADDLPGFRWMPSPIPNATPLRVPVEGTLDDLTRKHHDFLQRLSPAGFRPVPPLRAFRVVHYRRSDQPLGKPHRLFELRLGDGSFYKHPQRRLVELAGMVRHLAIEAMTKNPPPHITNPAEWVEAYVAGHQSPQHRAAGLPHAQFSYLPLPSIGHHHADPAVRRVLIAAPLGDEPLLDHLARCLRGNALVPLRPEDLANHEPPVLQLIRSDNVSRCYTEPASVWHSFTPVILPGHDDHEPAKRQRLVRKALAQAGIDHPCEFEVSPLSHWPKALSAHKYTRDGNIKRPTGHFVPEHLRRFTACHLTLRFAEGFEPVGPLVIGAGRHCGLGLMAHEAG